MKVEKKKEGKEEKMNAATIFGIPKDKWDVVAKDFARKFEKNKDFESLAKALKIAGAGELGMRCFLYGRAVQESESKARAKEMMAEMKKKVESLNPEQFNEVMHQIAQGVTGKAQKKPKPADEEKPSYFG